MAGEFPFESSLRRRVEILRGVPVSQVREIVAGIEVDPHIEAFLAEHRDRCTIVTGNLDTRNGELVMELLARLHSELQITLVLVTHDEWIAERADRVLRLADGRLVTDSGGPAAEEAAPQA